MPGSIQLSVPENCEMVVDDSRSIDFVILPESNKLRGVTWTSSDENVATVDEWGRVPAPKAGTVTITATAKAAPTVTDSGEITVVDSLADLTTIAHKDIVNYEGSAATEVDSLQKYVDRYTKDEAINDSTGAVPQTVKNALNDGTGSTAPINDGNVTWTLENIGMCRFIMPVIGLTLPFFSYGGSSIVTLFCAMGVVSGRDERLHSAECCTPRHGRSGQS